jgi:anti-anti-sigma factor
VTAANVKKTQTLIQSPCYVGVHGNNAVRGYEATAIRREMSHNTDEPIDEKRRAPAHSSTPNSFHFDSSGDESTVSVIGEVDLANISMFDSMVQKAVSARKPIRIDLTRCTYLGSTLINSIITVATRPHVQLRISVTSSSIRRVFQIVGLDKIVPIDDVGHSESGGWVG